MPPERGGRWAADPERVAPSRPVTRTALRGRSYAVAVRPFAEVPGADWDTLADVVALRATSARERGQGAAALLRLTYCVTPFVLGITGAVAVGKSTAASALAQSLEARGLSAQIISTDSFLLSNQELAARSLSHRKGHPQSYDRRAMLRFASAVKAGLTGLSVPVYSHAAYDIVADTRTPVEPCDVLILEGVNVLAPGPTRADQRAGRGLRDFLDYAVYIDAAPGDVRGWFIERLVALREGALEHARQTADSGSDKARAPSLMDRLAAISEHDTRDLGDRVWREINGPNLVEHIAPSRAYADAVMLKGADHRLRRVLIRRG
jgi:type I pantothenate kinase